ncbi:DUF2509 family protein [Dickeya sp. CFBP 2040]|nr:DUF2509 family protein [Dickeya sp. CFBP 2040]
MLIMMTGVLMLGGLQRQLDIQVQQGIDEQRFWQAFNQGLSALNWGMGLRWHVTAEWQCQIQPSAQLRACLRVTGENRADQIGLLRAEGKINGDPQPLVFYHRVMVDAVATDGVIRPIAGGWLDFCPDTAELACDPV